MKIKEALENKDIPFNLIEGTKHLPGIRYKVTKKGDALAYANTFTMTADLFRCLTRKLSLNTNRKG